MKRTYKAFVKGGEKGKTTWKDGIVTIETDEKAYVADLVNALYDSPAFHFPSNSISDIKLGHETYEQFSELPESSPSKPFVVVIKDEIPEIKRTITKEEAIDEIRKGKFTPPALPEVKKNFYGREEALKIAFKYIDAAMKKGSYAYATTDKKFSLLGTSGMKGIGKTELLKQIVVVNQTGGVKAVYVTFNGGKSDFTNTLMNLVLQKCLYNDAFAQGLLISCGVPEEIASKLNFKDAISEFRLLLNMNNDDTLLICVDEIGELQKFSGDHATLTLSSLMSMMDFYDGKLIFIFAHIVRQFLEKASTGSGRPVITLPLTPLSIDIWKKIPGLKEAANKYPSLHQLFLSCSGHPRSIFDGIAEAVKEHPSLLSSPTEETLILVRDCIIRQCKFNDLRDFLEDILLKWFSLTEMKETEKEKLKSAGLLQTMYGSASTLTVEFPFPLLVQDWARRNSKDLRLAYYLNQIYAADAVLGPDTEKKMEPVMYHYEAVIRIALNNEETQLKKYYSSRFFGDQFHPKLVSSPLPKDDKVVQFMEDFSDIDKLVQLLNSGYIVVSNKHSEEGIKYYVPFVSKNKLIVAAVQCKFVQKSVDWGKIKTKFENATKNVKKKMEVIPVIYTTVDQNKMHKKTYSDGIYFTEEDIFYFTSKLGVLRLHTQKLGQVLRKKFPQLERASSDLGTGLFSE